MSKRLRGWVHRAAVATLVMLAGCGREEPVGVGDGLLDVRIRTVEVTLPAERFLADAVDAGIYSRRSDGATRIVAAGFGGVLDAHALSRFAPAPAAVTYVDRDGTVVVDSMPTYPGGRLIVRVDTLRSLVEGPVELSLYRVAQEWDPATATWTLAVDSLGRQVSWTEPGGTRGELVGQALWSPAEDSVLIPVDSLTVAIWSDTLDLSRGALLVAESPGTRLRLSQLVMRYNARPSERPDTLLTVTVGERGGTFVTDPPAPDLPQLQVAGVPTWRSFLTFVERLDTVTVCGGTPELCRPLSDLAVNHAALVVRPAAAPAGFLPDDTVRVMARQLLVSDAAPFFRSPLGDRLTPGSRPTVDLAPERFVEGGLGGFVEIPITGFVAALARPPGEGGPPGRHMALVSLPEGGTFGFGAFHITGEDAPRLRLVVSAQVVGGAP